MHGVCDLNPVLGGYGENTRRFDYTSVQQRAKSWQEVSALNNRPFSSPMVDAETVDADDDDTLCRFRLMDYL